MLLALVGRPVLESASRRQTGVRNVIGAGFHPGDSDDSPVLRGIVWTTLSACLPSGLGPQGLFDPGNALVAEWLSRARRQSADTRNPQRQSLKRNLTTEGFCLKALEEADPATFSALPLEVNGDSIGRPAFVRKIGRRLSM